VLRQEPLLVLVLLVSTMTGTLLVSLPAHTAGNPLGTCNNVNITIKNVNGSYIVVVEAKGTSVADAISRLLLCLTLKGARIAVPENVKTVCTIFPAPRVNTTRTTLPVRAPKPLSIPYKHTTRTATTITKTVREVATKTITRVEMVTVTKTLTITTAKPTTSLASIATRTSTPSEGQAQYTLATRNAIVLVVVAIITGLVAYYAARRLLQYRW